MAEDGKTPKEPVSKQGQEALGRIAQDLLKTPVVSGALSTVFEAREHAVRAQEMAMGALGLPSAADVERLTRRLRSVSQRLEGLEDGVDRIAERLDKRGAAADLDARLAKIEESLARIETALLTSGPADGSSAPGADAPTP
jgi:hypothetical protein